MEEAGIISRHGQNLYVLYLCYVIYVMLFMLCISKSVRPAHPTSIQRVLEALYLEVKYVECEAIHSPPLVLRLRTSGVISPFPHMLSQDVQGHLCHGIQWNKK
jgi:hypothetical protein